MSHPSQRTAVPPCLPLGIKDSLKEEARLLLFGFLMGKAFGREENCLREKIVEGKNS
jgi:hypothetical protein